ncbi:MAG: AI-2E family transporter [Proteobacteria bacterium]|nr:AI-2E family transporter [Pseudomonadota bacterium]
MPDEARHPEDNLAANGATRAQQIAKGALVLLLVLAGLWTLHRYVNALTWATILAIAVWPLYRRAQHRWPPGKHNILLPAVFTLAVALVFLIPLALVGVEVAREAHTVLDTIDQAREQGIPEPAWLAHLPFMAGTAAQWWQTHLATPESANELLDHARESAIANHTRALGEQALHRVVLFGFTLMTLFFLFREGHRLRHQFLRASHRAFGPSGERIGRQMIASVHGTVDGLVLVGLGEGFLMGVGYVIAGVPHPALLGMFTAIAAMVPFGAPIAFGIAALILLVQDMVAWAVAIVVLGVVVTFVADHFVRPVLIGKTTRLPFLWVLLGILGGVETWGLVGLFLGPAIMAALILLWREWTG